MAVQVVPCHGCWALAFGDGLTDEAMFAVVNYSIKVGNEASRAEEGLRGHESWDVKNVRSTIYAM
jgi:trehalose-6-phosphatase